MLNENELRAVHFCVWLSSSKTKMVKNDLKLKAQFCCVLMLFVLLSLLPAANAAADSGAKAPAGMAALPLKLPKPMFVGTPQNIKGVKQLEKPLGKPRPPFFAPKTPPSST